MSTLRVRLAAKEAETQDICRLELVALEGETLPPFTAGANVELYLPGDLVRAYSLCNDPAERHRYVLGVLKDANSRGGSRAVHEQLKVGDTITIGVPHNLFALAQDAKRSLLLGGGIGVTPLLAMAEQLHREGAAFDLHYTVATQDRLAFGERLKQAPFAANVHTYFSQQGSRMDLAAVIGAAEDGRHLYVCGPQRFIDAVLETARAQGWTDAQLHYEFFGAAEVDTSGDKAFTVKIASSGQEVLVPADKTALKALQDAGIQVPMACDQGVCGTCLTRVISGDVDHRDLYLTDEEQAANDQFLPCRSRAKSACLVLDL
jgi:vanillate O-demethylase ferredoxin subunit